MAQSKKFEWTNPATAVARNLDVGFTAAKVEIFNLTTPAALAWTSNMATASIFNVGVPAYTTTNGVTPLSQNAAYGATISAFTNANPGVITVNDTATFGFAAGDTIKVAKLADDGADPDLSLNRADTYTIASLTSTTITLDQNTSADNVYVSGGVASRVSDVNGSAIPTQNFAIRGVTLGTSAVGGNSESMVAIVYGDESVV
jgi:hypothetical protein